MSDLIDEKSREIMERELQIKEAFCRSIGMTIENAATDWMQIIFPGEHDTVTLGGVFRLKNMKTGVTHSLRISDG